MHHTEPTVVSDSRQLSGAELVAALRDSRARTLVLVNDLTPAQWSPSQQLGVNPIAWELAHIAWFTEFWILRGPQHRDAQGYAQAAHPPRFAGPDTLFDSARLAHARRWIETMPTRAELEPMLSGQMDACIAALPLGADQRSADAQDPLYFHRLALFHEDMHAEAFCWMRAALGYPAPRGVAVPQVPPRTLLALPDAQTRIGIQPYGAGLCLRQRTPRHAPESGQIRDRQRTGLGGRLCPLCGGRWLPGSAVLAGAGGVMADPVKPRPPAALATRPAR